MSKHTPGPWKLELGRDGAPRGLRGPAEVEHRNIVNWNGFSSPTKPASMANARLIAAAPELLEALDGMLEVYGGEHEADGLPKHEIELNLIAYARAAIAKARGEA